MAVNFIHSFSVVFILAVISSSPSIVNCDAEFVDLKKQCEGKEAIKLSGEHPFVILKSDGISQCNINIESENYAGIYVHIQSISPEISGLINDNDTDKCPDGGPFLKLGNNSWCQSEGNVWVDLMMNLTKTDKKEIPFQFDFKSSKLYFEIHMNVYNATNDGQCEEGAFKCLSRCIPQSLRCNGYNNCGGWDAKGEDEADCPSGSNSSAGTVVLVLLFIVILIALVLVGIKYYRRRNYLG